MKFLIKLSLIFVLFTIALTIAWDSYFPGRIYYCTDHVGLDYLQPGNWIHGSYETVAQVSTDRDMSEPDVIKSGWTMGILWSIWFFLLTLSFASSFFLARLLGRTQWNPKKYRTRRSSQPARAPFLSRFHTTI